MTGFVYLEGRIAEVLGISTATLRKGRKLLNEGEHWGRIDFEGKQRVAYSMDGVTALLGKKSAQAVLGSKAIAALEKSDIGLILHASDICADAPNEGESGGTAGGETESACAAVQPLLLNAPWEVPNGVLLVERLTLNGRIMLCRLDEGWIADHGYQFFHRLEMDPRRLMRVRVKSTAKFIKGMPVECRHVDQDLWECTQRLPRWKGRY